MYQYLENVSRYVCVVKCMKKEVEVVELRLDEREPTQCYEVHDLALISTTHSFAFDHLASFLFVGQTLNLFSW